MEIMQDANNVRSQIILRRTYNRPTNDEGTTFETWPETVERVISHQRWLWERARGSKLNQAQTKELEELRTLHLEFKALLAGRTLWLGGTELSKRREACNFNCAGTEFNTVHDAVDIQWLLLQGCGVGAVIPVVGNLSGFTRPINTIEVVRSERLEKGGLEHNVESFDDETKTWTITIGDSAEAWAKSVGKILGGKFPADKLILDFSEIRPAGQRLKGYGWISSGDETISVAFVAIANILNIRAGQLLKSIDILDIFNWMGSILSSRRSAEIALMDYSHPDWKQFSIAKKDYFINNPQRAQSNNSILFYKAPTRKQLEDIFDIMQKGGGSEPGFINAEATLKRAPWFGVFNPCAEATLIKRGFCNLVTVAASKFNNNFYALRRAMYIMARANYRQTCVCLLDGILQDAWHQNNEVIRLLGVDLNGLVQWKDFNEYNLKELRNEAIHGAYSMADELNLPRPKNVTLIKPNGTCAKILNVTEGIHKPLGKYLFNNVNFSKHDPLVNKLREANYRVFDNPTETQNILVTLPVKWDNVDFDCVDGKEVNIESAITQLERYRIVMRSYVDQNASITVSYSPDEVPEIIDWLERHWNDFIGVSWLYRNDATKTAKDLGYLYLPQEVVTEECYNDYVRQLKPFNIDDGGSLETELEEDCVGGVCPIR